jgi:hypothetical protein
MTSVLAAHLWLAAAPPTNQPSGQGQEFGSSGPVALILIIVLFIAVAFLIRSMAKHLKRVPASFDPEDQEAASETTSDTASDTADQQAKQDH